MRNSFLLYAEYEQYFDLLPAEEQAKLIKALFAVFNEKDTCELEKQMEPATKMAFAFMRTQLDADTKKYQEKCEKLRENGAKGGAPKGNQNAKSKEEDNQMVELGEENNQNNQKVEETTKNNQKQQDKELVLVTKDLVLEEVISLVNNKKINIIDYIINARVRAREEIKSNYANYPISEELASKYMLVLDVWDLFVNLLNNCQLVELAYKSAKYDKCKLVRFMVDLPVEELVGIACKLRYWDANIANERAYILGVLINKYEQSDYNLPTQEERIEEIRKLKEQLDNKFSCGVSGKSGE